MKQQDTLELSDIQGMILSGYGQKPTARYAIFEVIAGDAARHWLGKLIHSVQFGSFRGSRRREPPYLGNLCANVAFTHEGFRALGLQETALAGFSQSFQEGMHDESRARRLGDDGASAPQNWRWGRSGERVHGVLAVFAGDREAKDDDWLRIEEFISAQLCRDNGVRSVTVLDTLASNQMRRKEHFGFRDGIANPRIGKLPRSRGDDIIPPGEILLGHENAYGQLPLSPEVPAAADPRGILPLAQQAASGRRDFGKNGSYLVFRQLEQDVRAFWRFVEDARSRVLDAPPGRAGREWLAAKMVGRWPNGTPLVVFPNEPGPATQQDADTFTYGAENDSFGARCPIGSHIRRTNPRDTALPVPHDPELSGDPSRDRSVRDRRISLVNRHRILRRGRAYGPPVDEDFDLDALLACDSREERGLHFLCFNANLSRQFEFVQSNWALNPSFAGLSSDPDPLLGADRRVPFSARDFTLQGCPVRRVRALPRVVELRGGAYFFMPSRRALAYLASNR